MNQPRTTRSKTRKFVATLAAASGLLLAAAGTAHATPASTGDDPDTIAEIMRTAQTLGAEWPILRGTMMYAAWLAPDTYAQTGRDGITFNKFYTTNPAQWRADYAVDMAAGFHPSGCDAIEGTTIHEAAHVIDIRTGRIAETIMLKQFADGTLSANGLTTYSYNPNGTINAPEAVAESFQAVQCSPSQATDTERGIYAILVAVGR